VTNDSGRRLHASAPITGETAPCIRVASVFPGGTSAHSAIEPGKSGRPFSADAEMFSGCRFEFVT
jgi:hypothetical protein